MGVYCCSEGTKLLIKLVLEVLHGLSEEFFGDERARIGGDIHCLDFARDDFPNGRMCEVDCRVVGAVVLGLCCIGGGMARWRISGAAADSPLTILCM